MDAHTLRHRLFVVLHRPSAADPVARYTNYFLAFLIVANALFVSLATVPAIGIPYHKAFVWFEAVSTGFFAIEYVARVWTCVEVDGCARPIVGRLRYARQPLPLLDLIVIVTFWFPIDLRFLRVARMVRLLNVLRLDHFEASLRDITEGLRRRSELMIVSITIMALSIYVSSALLYQLEHAAQPTHFTSIPATFWWAVETLTTIGYGDMVPITPLGRIFAGLIAVFGVGIFALPTAIVTAAIVEAGASDPKPVVCVHCGKQATADGHRHPPVA